MCRGDAGAAVDRDRFAVDDERFEAGAQFCRPLPAWIAAGGELETDDVVPEPGDIVLTGGGLPVLALEVAARLPAPS